MDPPPSGATNQDATPGEQPWGGNTEPPTRPFVVFPKDIQCWAPKPPKEDS